MAEKDLNITATLEAENAYKNSDLVVIATTTIYETSTQYFDTISIENVIVLVLKSDSDATMVIESTIPI